MPMICLKKRIYFGLHILWHERNPKAVCIHFKKKRFKKLDNIKQ